MFDDLIQQSPINVICGMIWNDGCSPIGMFEEHMASFLPLKFKPHLFQNLSYFSCLEDRQFF